MNKKQAAKLDKLVGDLRRPIFNMNMARGMHDPAGNETQKGAAKRLANAREEIDSLVRWYVG